MLQDRGDANRFLSATIEGGDESIAKRNSALGLAGALI